MNCSYHITNQAVVHCNRCARPLCPACDHRIKGFPYCQDCIVAGVELLQQQTERVSAPLLLRRKTSKWIALLLSFVVPGLGAAYNGQTSKALIHFAIFACFFQMATVTDAIAFFVIGVIGIWLFAAVDAYRTAELIRAGLAPDAESDAIARRLYGNPLAWAVVSITLGTIFLLRTLMGVRLPVQEMLPVALVALGAYMLFDYLRSRRLKSESVVFDSLTPPSAIAGGAPLDMTRFSTGAIAGDTAARQQPRADSAWPLDPRA
ncbi:MAG: B-box zinc finger protein [Pyrinomonadaceae bacterium]